MKRVAAYAPLLLLAIAAFVAPITGGYIASDVSSVGPGFANLLTAAIGGSDVPLLTHALIALPILLSVILVFLSRRVQQTPKQPFATIWVVFFVLTGASAVLSSFRALSFYVWFEWLVYGFALFAAVGAVGRKLGPMLIVSAVTAGCFIVAIKGIQEYGVERQTDPTWRIFAGWIDPNATAAILLIGLFLALGLCLNRARLESLVAGVAAAAIFLAMTLTGSKGAMSFALPIGVLVFGAIMAQATRSRAFVVGGLGVLVALLDAVLFVKNVAWIGIGLSLVTALGFVTFGAEERRTVSAARLIACFVGAAGLVALVAVTTKAPPSGSPPPSASQTQITQADVPATPTTPFLRTTQGGADVVQSTEFRKNLWKSALYLIKERWLTGYGLGSYRYESGRAGLTTATVFAHNSYLQLWAECGLLPFGLYFAGFVSWLWCMFRFQGKLPVHQRTLLAGIVAAIIALSAHATVDSDLSSFGIGVVFFMLLGVGLLVSGDSTAPELASKSVRVFGALGAGVLALLLFTSAAADDAKGSFRYLMERADAQGMQANAGDLDWVAAFDGDANYLQAFAATSHEDQLKDLQRAVDLTPTERNYRALAKSLLNGGSGLEAIRVLKEALRRDPNNLNTLEALLKAQQATDEPDDAAATASRMVATESTPYFKIRSIPQSIPTQTYEARIEVLAPREPANSKRRAELLAEAVRGMEGYANTTYPYVTGYEKDTKDPDRGAPGYDTLSQANAKLEKAEKAAKEAAQIYSGLGDRADAEAMDAGVALFAGALGGNK